MKQLIDAEDMCCLSQDEMVGIKLINSLPLPFYLARDSISVYVLNPISTVVLFSSVPQAERIRPIGLPLFPDHHKDGLSVLTDSGLKLYTKFLQNKKFFHTFCFNLRTYKNKAPSRLIPHVEVMTRLAKDLTICIDIDSRKVSKKTIKLILADVQNKIVPYAKRIDLTKMQIALSHLHRMEIKQNRKEA